MKKSVKYILFVLIIIMVIATVFYMNTRPTKVDAITIITTDIKTWFIEDGTTKANQDYNMISIISGKVLQVLVSKNEYVEVGTIIAKIDTKDYLTQIQIHKRNIESYNAQIADVTTKEINTKDSYNDSIDQLKAKLVQVESEIKLKNVTNISTLLPNEQMSILDLSIEQCQTELDYDKNKYEVNLILYNGGIISKDEHNGYEQKYQTTQNKMNQLVKQKESLNQEINRLNSTYGNNNLNTLNETAKNELDEATLNEIKVQILAMEKDMSKDYKMHAIENYNSLIAVEETAIKSLEGDILDCNIVANKSGYITELPIANESSVYPQSLLCTIKQSKDMIIESYVSTTDVVHISIGDSVELIQKTRESDIICAGIVTSIEGWAEERVSALGVIEHKVKVTIQPQSELKTAGSGFDVDVKYFTFVGENCIVLPNSAFYRYDEKDFVFIIDKQSTENIGVLKVVSIKKGSSTNSETVVLEGLQEGDIIIKNGSAKEISEGEKVSW